MQSKTNILISRPKHYVLGTKSLIVMVLLSTQSTCSKLWSHRACDLSTLRLVLTFCTALSGSNLFAKLIRRHKSHQKQRKSCIYVILLQTTTLTHDLLIPTLNILTYTSYMFLKNLLFVLILNLVLLSQDLFLLKTL